MLQGRFNERDQVPMCDLGTYNKLEVENIFHDTFTKASTLALL